MKSLLKTMGVYLLIFLTNCLILHLLASGIPGTTVNSFNYGEIMNLIGFSIIIRLQIMHYQK